MSPSLRPPGLAGTKRRAEDTDGMDVDPRPVRTPSFFSMMTSFSAGATKAPMKIGRTVGFQRPSSLLFASMAKPKLTSQEVNDHLVPELEGKVVSGLDLHKFIQQGFGAQLKIVTDWDALPGSKDHLENFKTARQAYLSLMLGDPFDGDRRIILDRLVSLLNVISNDWNVDVKAQTMEGRKLEGSAERRPLAVLVDKNQTGDLQWENILLPIFFGSTAAKDRAKMTTEATKKSAATIAMSIDPTQFTTMSTHAGPSKSRRPLGGKSKASAPKSAPSSGPQYAEAIDPKNLAGFAQMILSSSPCRQHMLGLAVQGEGVCLWYFDRMGAIGTAPVDISTDDGVEAFYTAMRAIMQLSADGWGFISNFSSASRYPESRSSDDSLTVQFPSHSTPTNKTPPSQNPYPLPGLTRLNRERSFLGRATLVYSFGAEFVGGPFVLKASWQPKGRIEEASLIQKALDSGVQGVPEVYDSSTLVALSDGLRGRLHEAAEGALLDIPYGLVDREFRALILRPKLLPMRDFPVQKFPLEFLEVMKQCMLVHREITFRAGLLHRDINPDNLMYRGHPTEKTMMAEGFIIDLDFAADWKSPHSPPRDDDILHTISWACVAIDQFPEAYVYKGPDYPAPAPRSDYLYRHDLESFFWSIWWILLSAQPSPEGPGTDLKFFISMLSEPNLVNIRNSKIGFLATYRASIDSLVWGLWPSRDEEDVRNVFSQFLGKMSLMILNGYNKFQDIDEQHDIVTGGGHITIEHFLSFFPS